ncbi:carbon-nitrogen family hydrolase [bacterium]|nr:carbon-nitrogen family hydrolase [bacterium]
MKSQLLTITLVQMNVALGDPGKNLKRCRQLLDSSKANPDIILLPELWSSGYDYENFSKLAATTPTMLKHLADIAKTKRSYIGGSLVEADNNRFYNTFFLIDPNGQQIAAYRKIHLFSLMNEEKHFSPGLEPCLINIGNLPVGLMTCYDIRFPELSRNLALRGAKLLLICAQWPKPRTAHWRTLLKARAIENQLYVAACNRIGKGVENHFPGNSAIYDPWGTQTLRTPARQGAFSTTIALGKIEQTRTTIACFNDRRPETYSGGLSNYCRK